MAGVKISELPAASTPLAGTELLAVVQGGVTKQASADDIAAAAFLDTVANGAVATTLGSVGPTGSTAGNPQGWIEITVAGTNRYIPFW